MMTQAIAPTAVTFEYMQGLIDAQAMEAEYGQPIQINYRLEGQVTRDLYGSIINRSAGLIVMTQNAATITYQPIRRELEKAGLREECDILIYVAMQDFIDQGLSFDDLEIKRMTIGINAIPFESSGNRYEVKEKSKAGAFGDGYLYVTFGLKRG